MPKKAKEEEIPVWLKYSKDELEQIILKLAKQGMKPARIGLILRDSYGIPSSKLFGEKISKILAKHNIKQEQEDLVNLKQKSERLAKHLTQNKQDKVAKRGLQLIQAKIIKLKKYYKINQK